VTLSVMLRRLAARFPWVTGIADSLYVTSCKVS
jgi:hypothetical protein